MVECAAQAPTGFLLPDRQPSDLNADMPSAKPWMLRIGGALLLAAGGAFAVAGLSTADKPVAVQQLVESVSTMGMDAQIQSLSNSSLHLFRSDTSRSSDTPDSMLTRLGVSDKAAADFFTRQPVGARELVGPRRSPAHG